MNKITYIIIALISLLITASVAIKHFVNLNHYKPLIEQKISWYTDRKITINGDIKFSILPVPSINFYDVELASLPGAVETNILSFKKLTININLLPLFSKKIVVSNVLITEPIIVIEQLKNGQKNWDLILQDKFKKPSVSKDKKLPPQNTITPMDLSVDNIEIVGGKIIYITSNGRFTIDDLTATLVSNSLQGPYKLNGFVKLADQDIRFQLKIKQIADSIPIKLKLDVDSTDVILDGIWMQSIMQFQGYVDAKTNAKSLEATIQKFVPKFNFPECISGPLNAEGRMTASEDSVKIDNLIINIDQENFNGSFEANFKPRSIKCTLNGSPGNTDVMLNIMSKKSNHQGQLCLNTQSSRKLMKWLAFSNLVKIPDVLTGITNFKTDFNIVGDQIRYDNIELKIKDMNLKGLIESNIAGTVYDYQLNINGFMPVAQFLGIPFCNDPGLMTVAGKIVLAGEKLDYENTANIAGIKINSSGKIELNQRFNSNNKFSIKTVDTKKLWNAFDIDAAFLKSFTVATAVTFNNNVLNMDDIVVTAGLQGMPINIKGYAHTELGNRPFIDAELKIDQLPINLLLANLNRDCANKLLPSKNVVRQNSALDTKTTDEIDQTIKLSNDSSNWSSSPVNLTYLNTIDGKFRIVIDQLAGCDLVLKNFTTTLSLNKGLLDVPDIHADFLNGEIRGLLKVNTASDPAWLSQITISKAVIQKPTRELNKIDLVEGILNAKGDFSSVGKSVYDWIANLQGRLHIDVNNGVVSGFNFGTLINGLQNSLNTIKINESLSSTLATGKTDFNQCSASINFDKGIGKIENLSLTADWGHGTCTGHIDLPHYEMDVIGSLQLTALTNLPLLKIHLLGPLDNPSKNFDADNLKTFLTDNLLAKLKGINKNSLKNASTVLNALLSNKKTSTTLNNDGVSKSTSTPNSSIRDKSSKIRNSITSFIQPEADKGTM